MKPLEGEGGDDCVINVEEEEVKSNAGQVLTYIVHSRGESEGSFGLVCSNERDQCLLGSPRANAYLEDPGALGDSGEVFGGGRGVELIN